MTNQVIPEKKATLAFTAYFLGLFSLFCSTATADPPTMCDAEEREISNLPFFLLGASPDFEKKVVTAFPIGSCAKDLFLWMDAKGFQPPRIGFSETNFTDEQQEFERDLARRMARTTIITRVLLKNALVGKSYYFVAWNTDRYGRISEIYADAREFDFDLP